MASQPLADKYALATDKQKNNFKARIVWSWPTILSRTSQTDDIIAVTWHNDIVVLQYCDSDSDQSVTHVYQLLGHITWHWADRQWRQQPPCQQTGFRNTGRYPKNPAGCRVFWVNPPKKTHPKFNPVSFHVLLITKDFIMFKAFNSTSDEFAK